MRMFVTKSFTVSLDEVPEVELHMAKSNMEEVPFVPTNSGMWTHS